METLHTGGGREFVAFMAGPIGRGIRAALGLAIILVGLALGGWFGVIVALVGAVPLVAAASNFCLVAPVLHAPFWGRDARA